MTNVKQLCGAFLVAGCVAGCRTMPLPRPEPIAVPNGLSERQVESAVLEALKDHPPDKAPALNSAIVVTRPGDALLLSWLSQRRAGEWFPESREPGVIFAGYQQGDYYLRVAIHYNVSTVTTQIVDSRNLNQTDTRIHKSAVAWEGLLETRIRRSLGSASFQAD